VLEREKEVCAEARAQALIEQQAIEVAIYVAIQATIGRPAAESRVEHPGVETPGVKSRSEKPVAESGIERPGVERPGAKSRSEKSSVESRIEKSAAKAGIEKSAIETPGKAGAEAGSESVPERRRHSTPEPRHHSATEARVRHAAPHPLGLKLPRSPQPNQQRQGRRTGKQESSKHDSLLSLKTPLGRT
jgi:hypothetical protein